MDSVFGAIVETISQMGALGVSAIVIWALVTERLVPRGRLDDLKADRDRIAAILSAERQARGSVLDSERIVRERAAAQAVRDGRQARRR